MIKKILILATLFVLIKSYCEPESDELRTLGKIRDYEDCEARTSTDELEEEGAYKCCHLYYIHDSNNIYQEVDTCVLITQTQYDNIKNWVDDYEKYGGYEDVRIHCKGFSIQFSLLALLSLLFLI